jgi:heme-degrading monooxygenase HmoA
MLLTRPALAADAPKVLQVIAVKVKAGQQDAYMERVKKLNAMYKRLDIDGTMRVWRAQIAGPDSGLIYIGTEFDSLEAFAKGTSKLAKDSEWNATVKEPDVSGMRELLGTSLLVEITP